VTQYNIQKGTTKGTYIVNFMCQKSQKSTILIQFENPQKYGTFFTSTQTLKIKINPAATSQYSMVSSETALSNCVAGSQKLV